MPKCDHMVSILPKVTSLDKPCNWHRPSGMETHGRCSQHAWRVNDFDSSQPFFEQTAPSSELDPLGIQPCQDLGAGWDGTYGCEERWGCYDSPSGTVRVEQLLPVEPAPIMNCV